MIEAKSLRGLDNKSVSVFIQLLNEILNNRTSLYLGAGVSASVGIPTWHQLIEQICSAFFYHWEFLGTNKIPKNLSITFWEDTFWSDGSKRLAKKLAKENLINVTEQIKRRIAPADWIYLIRKLLYYQNDLKPSNLLAEIIKLFSTEYINTVITSNYDDLLEKQLKEKGVRCKSIAFQSFKKNQEKIVIHPNGILPINGGEQTKIIFTESEYVEEFSNPYSWTNLIQLNEFNHRTCLFIGTSFTDINLVKLLRVSREQSRNMHYTFVFNDPSKDNKIKELFYHYLYDLGIKSIILPMKHKSDFSKLPKYIRLINDCLSDKHHELRKYVKSTHN